MNAERVIVGMSGGVDSSVAALLLRDRGYDVHGLYMFNWDEDEQGYCTAAEDYQDARQVCENLDIPLHKISFAAEYRREVFEVFLADLERGITPNPDVLCNREIKFGHFLNHARRLGARRVATGHYARRRTINGEHHLLRGVDEDKDQSYFLHAVSAEALGHTLFPLGELQKPRVREIALGAGLHVGRKRDSTGICFIGERPFREFIAGHIDTRPGDIQTVDGQTVGRHIGLPFYTLGQRQGLGIGGVRNATDDPWYLAAKDAERNILVVVQGREHPLLYSTTLQTGPVHWINGPPQLPLECSVATRYRQMPAKAVLSADGDGCRVDFALPQWAVTPGQYAVIYQGERCLGGAGITGASPADSGQSLYNSARSQPRGD